MSAISAGASVGAAWPSRACCAEFDEKQPRPHGTRTNATATKLVSVEKGATSVSFGFDGVANAGEGVGHHAVGVARRQPGEECAARRQRVARGE